jgi:hypothetical protein
MHNLLTLLFCLFGCFGAAFGFLGEYDSALIILSGSLPIGVLAILFDMVEHGR